eukprot:6476703-Amphidinium_carterae.1
MAPCSGSAFDPVATAALGIFLGSTSTEDSLLAAMRRAYLCGSSLWVVAPMSAVDLFLRCKGSLLIASCNRTSRAPWLRPRSRSSSSPLLPIPPTCVSLLLRLSSSGVGSCWVEPPLALGCPTGSGRRKCFELRLLSPKLP